MTKSTSYAEVSPAKMCHAPALEKALKTAMGKLLAADYGENMRDSLANLDQHGSWQKMFEGYCQPLLISDQEETSELFCGTWPTWGMMRNGRVTVLKPLVRPTKEKESLSWPTPRAREGNSGEYGCKSCERNAGKFYLDGVVKQEEKIKGQLNADWVELLMNLPIGWTDIDKSNEDLDEWPGWPAPMNGQQWGTHTATGHPRSERFKKGVITPVEFVKDGIKANQYPYEPPRVVEGQKNRAKRLKCLGNGCVPAQIYPIFKAIMEAEK